MAPSKLTFEALREAYDYNMKYADEQMDIVAQKQAPDAQPSDFNMRHFNVLRAMAEYTAAAAIADAVLHALRAEAGTWQHLASPGYIHWKALYEHANNLAMRLESDMSTAMLESDVHRKLCLHSDPPILFSTEPRPAA